MSAEAKLAKLGIRSRFDLVLHLPLRYEDETRLVSIAAAQAGAPVQVEGTVTDSQIAYRPRRQLVCTIEDATGVLTMRFLNFYGSQAKALFAKFSHTNSTAALYTTTTKTIATAKTVVSDAGAITRGRRASTKS